MRNPISVLTEEHHTKSSIDIPNIIIINYKIIIYKHTPIYGALANTLKK